MTIESQQTPRPSRHCDNPDCPGWLHQSDSMGRGPGIERCDDCSIFPDDESAAAAHAKSCTCGMKPVQHG